jgi:hypothetical protein
MATRMQQRRGTASQWTSADPILASGEIGFETDTGQFKIGDGVNIWSDLAYFKDMIDLGGSLDDYIPITQKGAASGVATLDVDGAIPISQLGNLIDGAPNTLDTLNELATGITDLGTYVEEYADQAISNEVTARNTAISTAVSDHSLDTTNVHGIADTSALATHSDVDTAKQDAETYAASAVSTHNLDTTSVHGIADTSALETKTGAQDKADSAQTTAISTAASALSAHESDTTNIHGIADTSALATTTQVNAAKSDAETTAQGYVSTHNSATTSVHGITDTANLVYTNDSRLTNTRTPADGSVTEAKIADGAVTSAKIADGTIVNADISATAAIAATKISGTAITAADTGTVTSTMIADGTIVNGDISASAAIAQSKISGLTSDLAAKAPLAAPALTGNATAENLTISGNLTVNGTTTTVSTSNLEVTDSLIYLSSQQYDTDTVDIGIYGAYGDSNPGHFHTGLVRDASDAKWKLVSAGSEPTSNVVDFTSITYDTLKLGGVEFSDGTQTKQGVPSLTPINQQTASYTAVLTDRDKLIEISSASGVTLTIPTNASVAYPVGTSFDILQTGAGQITIAGASGVTVNATPGLKLRTQWSSATLLKRATDTWVVYGDLTA